MFFYYYFHYYVPGTVLGSEDKTVNQADAVPALMEFAGQKSVERAEIKDINQ